MAGNAWAAVACLKVRRRACEEGGEAQGEAPPRICEFYAPPRAGEQWRTEPILQIAHMATDGSMGDEELRCGLREVFQPCGGLVGL